MFICNNCFTNVEDKAVVTGCQHLFCVQCAQQAVEQNGSCLVCDSVLSQSSVKVARVSQDTKDTKLLLCGQQPETALATALSSVQFFVAQQQLQAELRETQLAKKVEKVQDACRKKLAEVHNGYVQAKRKYEEAMRSNQQLQQTSQQMQQDNQELQTKYAQRSMQARKLQEALKKAQQEVEMLRQNMTRIPVGRDLSPLAPAGQLHVTTLKRTTEILQSSPSNTPDFGNIAQQTFLPSSGRVNGISGGYRLPPSGHIGSGGGGGMLGGSMDPNSPAGILTAGTQAPRRAGAGGIGGTQHGGGNARPQSGSDQALRKMLGMLPAQTTMAPSRNASAMRNDLFSM